MSDGHEATKFVHRFIPAKNPEHATTLLLLHGTGGDENDLLDLGRLLDPNVALLSPRGKVLEQGMPRFFRRLAEGVFDLEDLQKRTYELADFIESASAMHGFDPTRVVAVGFSNGANIAGSMLLLRPNVLAGAILLHAMVPFLPEHLPDLKDKPIFLAAGRADPIVPISETERLVDIFKRSGANVSTYWHNGGHSLSHDEVRAARDWLRALPL